MMICNSQRTALTQFDGLNDSIAAIYEVDFNGHHSHGIHAGVTSEAIRCCKALAVHAIQQLVRLGWSEHGATHLYKSVMKFDISLLVKKPAESQVSCQVEQSLKSCHRYFNTTFHSKTGNPCIYHALCVCIVPSV